MIPCATSVSLRYDGAPHEWELRSYINTFIEEVRERRRRLMARHDNDLDNLYETIRSLQGQRPEKLRRRLGREDES